MKLLNIARSLTRGVLAVVNGVVALVASIILLIAWMFLGYSGYEQEVQQGLRQIYPRT